MPYYTILEYTPLVSAGLFLGLVVYQVSRDRYHTWTEVFFLAAFFCGGMYALSDFFFFTAATKALAEIAALSGFSFMTFTVLFFMLFGVVYYTRMRNELFLTIVPILLLLPFLWSNLIHDLKPLDAVAGPPPYIGVWDPVWFSMWTLYVLIYTLVGTWAFFRTYREVNLPTSRLKRRMQGILVALILAVVLGASTNVIRGISNIEILPLFSTALAIPGAVSWIALSPASGERFSVAVRHWKASRYDIKAAFMIFLDGTLIGAKVRPGEKIIDQDLFSATLDVIQNFMRTSFPALRGSLSAIKHGEYTLVMERGKYAYLTIVLQGEENDQLRRHMRDLLLGYERDNQPVLSDWRGIPAEAAGTDEMLNSLLEEK